MGRCTTAQSPLKAGAFDGTMFCRALNPPLSSLAQRRCSPCAFLQLGCNFVSFRAQAKVSRGTHSNIRQVARAHKYKTCFTEYLRSASPFIRIEARHFPSNKKQISLVSLRKQSEEPD